MENKKKTKAAKDTEDKPYLNHRKRLRDRYVTAGLDSFSDHEILEYLLFYSIPRRDTKKIAYRVMKEFVSLHRVFEASADEIELRCEVSRNTAILLSSIGPLFRRYELNKWGKHPSFDSTETLGEYIKCLFIGASVEWFYIICFNNRLKLIASERIAEGAVDHVTLYLSEVIRRASVLRPSFMVMAHNHPSGDLNISELDYTVTKEIMNGLMGIGVNLLDHYIVAGDDYDAFSERKILGLIGVEGALKAKKEVNNEFAKKKMSKADNAP